MPVWTSFDLLKALGLEGINHTIQGTGVSIDTRTIQPGDIFVAIKGETTDGHDYVNIAIEKGAAACIVEDPNLRIPGSHQIFVPSTMKALEDLGKYARTRTKAKVIAVTGSAGKTTVKEMLFHILSAFGKTTASKASYNNHIGVPLTLACMDKEDDFAIIEMGMNHPGEIAPLSIMTSPEISVITTVAEAHIGQMRNLATIAHEKSDVVCGMNKGGIILLPSDNPYFDKMSKKAKVHSITVLPFGSDVNSHTQLLSWENLENNEGIKVKARMDETTYDYTLKLQGEHSASNSLIALSVCIHCLGLNAEKVLERLSTFKPISGRGKFYYLRYKDGFVTLIDDAYNANPLSMRSGLAVLNKTKSTEKTGRRIAVLGEMRELGDMSKEYHQSLALVLDSYNIDRIFLVGTEMKALYDVLSEEKKGAWKETAQETIPLLLEDLKQGDIVLIKGSNGNKLSVMVDYLLKHYGASC